MTTGTLLVRCAGPMQSWGTRSRFGERDTEREPSKSGVVGLLCAALGRSRDQPVTELAALRMGVRVDQPGRLESDYQTALAVAKASGAKADTVLSRRYYLADADFLVGLEGPRLLLATVHEALRSPRWPLFLGRKGYVPGLPPYVPGGLVDGALLEALAAWRGTPGSAAAARQTAVGSSPGWEAVIECAAGELGDVRQDVPLSFSLAGRRFGRRRVRRVRLQPPPTGEDAPCS